MLGQVEKRQLSLMSIVILYCPQVLLIQWNKFINKEKCFKKIFKTSVSCSLKQIHLQSIQSLNTLLEPFLPFQAVFFSPPPSQYGIWTSWCSGGLWPQGFSLNPRGMVVMISCKEAALIWCWLLCIALHSALWLILQILWLWDGFALPFYSDANHQS